MKKTVCILFLLISVSGFCQKNEEVVLISNARSLHRAVFITKDSAELEKLFSDKLSYGHSGGRIENKQEAIQGIIHNASVYEQLNLGPTSIWMEGKTAVTRYNMSANEKTKQGKINPLKLHIILVWSKEKKDWKLIARQAMRLSQ
jgi:ketosteroid isomerase-like protein